MALPSSYGIEKNRNSLEGLRAYENGGKGSGNWGHAGRPGEVGGSSPAGVSAGALHSRVRTADGSDARKKVVDKRIEDARFKAAADRIEKMLVAEQEVLHPTSKLSSETLELGREAISNKLERKDEILKKEWEAGKRVTVNGKKYESNFAYSRFLSTPFSDKKSADVLHSVMGQLSDGIWENSTGMESYWRDCNIVTDDGGKTYFDINRFATSHLSRDRWRPQGTRNKYIEMNNDKIRNFWADKVRTVVSTEASDAKKYKGIQYGSDYSWRPDNNTELAYMHSYDEGDKRTPVTVGDAYKVWAALKPNKDRLK